MMDLSQEKQMWAAVVAAGVAGLVAFAWLLRPRKAKAQDTGLGVPEERITKQGFSIKQVPADLDAIVVGSGMGGMTVATILAKEGKKVLVLEQHDQAGGNTHVFEEHGFEFDTGLHYIGGKVGHKWSPTRRLFDYVTDGAVEWEKMDDHYDIAAVQGKAGTDVFKFHADIKQVRSDLVARFPEEGGAIDAYFARVRMIKSAMPIFFVGKLLPSVLRRALWALFSSRMAMFFKTTREVLDELTDNQELKGILGYQWGDFGELPGDSAFAVQALLVDHYNGGGYYPVGGPSAIARAAVRVVEKAGGKVLVRAPVEEVIINEAGAACGVRVKGKAVHAPLVISCVGAPITFGKLVPAAQRHRVAAAQTAIESPDVRSKVSLMSLFVGLRGTAEELELPKSNQWVFPSWDHAANVEDYQKDHLSKPLPAVFASFSSAKDPHYKIRCPNKQVALVIGPCYYDTVARFADGRVKHRGDEYQGVKKKLTEQLLAVFLRQYPHLKDKIEYMDLGTALTNDYYLGTHRGAVYGLAHTPERFRVSAEHLSPTTPIPGLYLSGQDVMTCGVMGAAAGGMLTAMCVSPRFLFGDARKLL